MAVMVVATTVVLSKRRESIRGYGTWVLWDVVKEDGWMGGAVVGCDGGEAGWVVERCHRKDDEV
ncbi:hypothetical protein DVH24_027654 [Malus domestica]|uniref:Uncharacterized protein n=1 Tax=Malus domestica TaxID=3750 RepID=A0A498HDX1_MALDO|nr:hypothetical protein DVH24_027654 [Malus domestica]